MPASQPVREAAITVKYTSLRLYQPLSALSFQCRFSQLSVSIQSASGVLASSASGWIVQVWRVMAIKWPIFHGPFVYTARWIEWSAAANQVATSNQQPTTNNQQQHAALFAGLAFSF